MLKQIFSACELIVETTEEIVESKPTELIVETIEVVESEPAEIQVTPTDEKCESETVLQATKFLGDDLRIETVEVVVESKPTHVESEVIISPDIRESPSSEVVDEGISYEKFIQSKTTEGEMEERESGYVPAPDVHLQQADSVETTSHIQVTSEVQSTLPVYTAEITGPIQVVELENNEIEHELAVIPDVPVLHVHLPEDDIAATVAEETIESVPVDIKAIPESNEKEMESEVIQIESNVSITTADEESFSCGCNGRKSCTDITR